MGEWLWKQTNDVEIRALNKIWYKPNTDDCFFFINSSFMPTKVLSDNAWGIGSTFQGILSLIQNN